jgi:quinol monooxygenase YgiN
MVISEKKVMVLTRYAVKEGEAEKFEKNLIEMVKPVRDKNECVAYEIYKSEGNERLYYTLEKWETLGKLSRNDELARLGKFAEKQKNLLESKPGVTLLDLIV